MTNPNLTTEIKTHWNKFYKKFNISSESSFSRFVINWLQKNKYNLLKKSLVDIGCGNSRDATYFSAKKFNVTGIDLSSTAIKINKKNHTNIDYKTQNICKKNFTLDNERFDYLYARFFLHAISLKDESQFLINCKKISKKNSIFLFEFRTTNDSLMNKGTKLKVNERVYGHYRRFIDVKKFLEKIDTLDFSVLYISQGKSYANLKKEHPHICRMILKRK